MAPSDATKQAVILRCACWLKLHVFRFMPLRQDHEKEIWKRDFLYVIKSSLYLYTPNWVIPTLMNRQFGVLCTNLHLRWQKTDSAKIRTRYLQSRRSARRVALRENNLGYTDSSLISRRSPLIVTLRGGIQEYFSEKHTQDQRGSNPGRMHDWRGSRVLYQCATSPSLYIQPIAELNNELSRRVAILEGLRW